MSRTIIDRTIDLRSDTVTQPTEAMREAMRHAEVGDDVKSEDPTVNRLQQLAAETVGTEAALFVASGTMGNTCALLAHSRHGEEVLFEAQSHMYNWEAGGYAVLAGLAAKAVPGKDGVMLPQQVAEFVRAENPHLPRARLVCIENTHNMAGGHALTPAEIEAVAAAAQEHGFKLHIDGARIFNAAVALGVDVRELVRPADSVMFCLSKGLSAPVGSLLCGTRAFIDEAYRARKRLGGAMRQVGVIAAAGIVALEESSIQRLAEDHDNARRLHAGLNAIEGFRAEQPPRPTNFAIANVTDLGWDQAQLLAAWNKRGILASPRPGARARLVTHRHISSSDIDYVIEATAEMVNQPATATAAT